MRDAAPTEDHVPLMQDPAFARALERCGQPVRRLSSGHILLTRRFAGVPVAMLPRAAPPPDLGVQLRSIGWHRRPVILSPETPCFLPEALPLRGPTDRAVLELAPDGATRLSRLHGKWRNQLRRAGNAGLRITAQRMRPGRDGDIFTLESRQRRARGYSGWPVGLTAAFADVAPAQTLLLRACRGREPLAHMLFLKHGSAMTYHMGHISPEGRACAAHNLLLWEGMERCVRAGCTLLDLGVLDARTPGLNRFKLRTGAARVATGGTWLYWRPFA